MSTLSSLLNSISSLAITIGNELQERGFKAGGTAGQVPTKINSTDFNWSWQTPATTDISGLLVKSANLSDLTNVATARANLGLGTAATTNSSAYATAAQGALADTALQSVPIATASVLGGIKSSSDILVDAGTGVATVNANAGGNGAADSGKLVKFGITGEVSFGGGGILITTVAPGLLYIGNSSEAAGCFIKSTNVTSDVTLEAPNASGTLATQEYADSLVVGLLDDRGNYNASGNVFPSSGGSGTAGEVLKGDLWTISVAGTLGGTAVTAGDVIRALVDTPGQTSANWVITENNLGYVPQNTAGTLALGGFSSITGTLADANISSAATWNAKQSAITFGTGVLTALGVNVGSAGAPVLFNGALGTPSSGNLANCTFPTLNQSTTGSAATLTTVRTIGGSNFDGSANVTSFPAPGAIGGTTPSTGAFTTLTITGLTSSGGGPSSFNATVRASGSLGAPNFAGTGDTNTGIHMPGSDVLNLVTNSLARWTINASGELVADATNGGGLTLTKTITAVATTGAQTINKSSGRVNFAAGATSLVVSNSLCTASSIIHCTMATNDATATGVRVVAAAGSFTIHLLTAPTAETAVNFLLTN